MTKSLEELSDRLEIQDLLVAYSYAIDFRDWDALDEVFTPDAFIDYTAFGGSSGNLEETKKFLAAAMPMFSGFQHMVATSLSIDSRLRRRSRSSRTPTSSCSRRWKSIGLLR